MKKQQQQQQQQHKKGGNSSSSVEKRLQHTNEDLQAKESESKKVAAELRAKVSECRALGKALETEGTEYLEDVKRKLQSVDSVVMKLKFQLKEVSRLKAQIKKRQTERSKHHKSRSAPRKNAKKAEEKEKEKEKEKEEEKEGEEEEEEENVTIKESGEDALEDARMLQELHEEERSIKATLRAIAPTSGGVLAQWFIGSVNLKLYGENEKFLMKTRYENFKVYSIVPFISLLLFYAFCPSYYISKFLLHVKKTPPPPPQLLLLLLLLILLFIYLFYIFDLMFIGLESFVLC